MALEDFLQEYVAEVEENIQELEQSLLTLEREGTSKEEMAQIFRAAHSIKGASAYMGFEGLAGLTHDMETFISQIQSGSRSGAKAEINILFQCVDFIRGALGVLQEKGEEPLVPSVLFAYLNGEADVGEPERQLESTEDYDFLFPPVESQPADGNGMDISFLIMPDKENPGGPLSSASGQVEGAGDFILEEDEAEEILEEDEELLSIFISNFRENLLALVQLLSGAAVPLKPEVFEKALIITNRLASSSQYMDYERVVQIVQEWEKALSECQLRGSGDGHQLYSFLKECGRRLQRALPLLGLDLAFATKEDVQAEIPSSEAIEEEDEELFQILIQSFQECLHELTQIALAPATSVTAQDLQCAQDVIRRMLSSALYMDYEQIAKILEEWQQNLLNSIQQDLLSRTQFRAGLEAFGGQLRRFLPQLDLSLAGMVARQPSQQAETLDEEDEELLGIFTEAFQQNYSQIAEYATSSADAALFGIDVEPVREALERMVSSSRYMGYENLFNLLTEWDEALLAAAPAGTIDEANYRSLLDDYTERLRLLVPSLSLPLVTKAEEAATAAESKIPGHMEPGFDDFMATALRPAEVPHTDQPQEPAPASEVHFGLQPPASDAAKAPSERDGATSVPEAQKTEATPTSTSATLRVDAQKVDMLLNQVGELVVNRSEFTQMATLLRSLVRELASQGKIIGEDLRRLRTLSSQLNESTTTLGRVTGDLQSTVMRVRMLPISQLFQRFPRVMRDQAAKLDKKVDLILEGAETEVDRRVLEQMYDPLVQFLRNSIAHGIERPGVRMAAGKPEMGVVRLAAYHMGDFVVIEVEDDGRGVDTQRLRKVLVDKGRLSSKEVERFTEEEILQTIFWPGISTHERVDGSAGRGVGLDVVKENVERMGGTIHVESAWGVGTRFLIRLPLTVAIIRALLVEEQGQIYSLPLGSVSEIVRLEKESLFDIEGFTVLTLRERTIPVFSLQQLVGTRGAQAPQDMEGDSILERHRYVVIASSSFQEVGLLVDSLYGEQEVVVKPVESDVHALEGFSGATILGDGTISLVLDVSVLLRAMQTRIKSTSLIPHGMTVN